MVFESCPDFSDNSRGFWEYVVKNTDYKTYWVIRDEEVYEELKKQGVVCGLDNSEEASQMIEKAQFLISSTFDFAVQKNVGQVHVSAWHGFPLKVIGFFDSASSEEDTFDSLKVITTQTDIITATSRFSRLTLSGMFAVDPRKVKETGYPRNDIMFWSDAKKELSKLLPIDVYNSKLFFYLPTMRKGLKGEGEQFDDNIFNYLDYDADEIDWFLEKNNAYIVAKVHFADAKKYKSGDFKLPERLIFLDNQELERHFCIKRCVAFRDAKPELLDGYQDDFDFIELGKLAIDYSDGVVEGEEEATQILFDYAKEKNKPVLTYPGEDIQEPYADFINKVCPDAE